MKRLVATLTLILCLFPVAAFATFGLTQSIDLEKDSSQYAQANDSVSLSPTTLTIEMWLNFESLPATNGIQMVPINKTNSADTDDSFNVGFSSADNSIFVNVASTLNFSSRYDCQTAANAVVAGDLGVWRYWAIVMKSSDGTIQVYKDNVQITCTAAGAGRTIADSTSKVTLGAQVSDAPLRFFDGKISLVHMWSVVRTTGEIATDACTVFGATTNLAAEWTLNNVYTDNSGNSNTLTSSGSPVFAVSVPPSCVTAPTFQLWPLSFI